MSWDSIMPAVENVSAGFPGLEPGFQVYRVGTGHLVRVLTEAVEAPVAVGRVFRITAGDCQTDGEEAGLLKMDAGKPRLADPHSVTIRGTLTSTPDAVLAQLELRRIEQVLHLVAQSQLADLAMPAGVRPEQPKTRAGAKK